MTSATAVRGVWKFLALAYVAVLSACGGGGGGGSDGDLSLDLEPSAVSARFYPSETRQFDIDARASGTVGGTVYIVFEDLQGVTDGTLSLFQFDPRHYRGTIKTRAGLPPGRHTGNFRIRLCADSGCNRQYTSTALGYDLTVLATPNIQSLSPDGVLVGSGPFEVVATGTAFSSDSVARFAGQTRSTRFISSTQLGIALTTGDTSTVGSYSIDLLAASGNPASAGTAATFEVRNPAPTVSALTPSSADFGGLEFQLQVDGANFIAGSVINWNGSPRPTQRQSSTRLTATIPDSDLNSGGTVLVTVTSPAPGGGTSSPLAFSVTSPLPTLSSVDPPYLFAAESFGQYLTLTGANFTRQSTGVWNGDLRLTYFASPTQLVVLLGPDDVDDGQVAQVAVFNPAPGGGTSAPVTLTISNPVPVLSSVHATRASAGCGSFELYVTGANFVPSTQVLWSGSSRPTTRISSSLVKAQISASDLEAAGTIDVKVSNPTPAGGVSDHTIAFSITEEQEPTTDAVAYQIDAGHSGYASTRCPINLPSTPAWTFTSNEPLDYPLVAEGRVFVTGKTSRTITALDAATGAKLWGPVDADSLGSSYDAGAVFASGGDANAFSPTAKAFDAATGAEKWSQSLGISGWAVGSVARDGRVIIGTEARAQDDGRLLWGASGSTSGEMAAVDASGVYTTRPCNTQALNPDGSFKWNRNTGCSGGGGRRAGVAQGTVYSSDFGFLYDLLDAATGAFISQVNTYALPARSPRHEVSISNGQSLNGKVIATGATWGLSADPGDLYFAPPLLINDTVFMARRDGVLNVHDANTGALLTTLNVGSGLAAHPANNTTVDTGLAAGAGLLLVPTLQGVTAYRLQP